MMLNQLLLFIFLERIFLNSSVESFKVGKKACYSNFKEDADANNLDYGHDMMVNYYAPYPPLRNSDVDIENTGHRIQSMISESESITTTERVTVGQETSSGKTVGGDSSHKMRMEDKLSILKALLLTDNSTELATRKAKFTTSSLLTVINFNTTINIISRESTLKSQLRKGEITNKPVRGEDSTKSVNDKDSIEHGEGYTTSKPGNNVDSNDIIKPAVFIALASKCEQIQNRVNNLEQLHKSLKSTNEDFSKEISYLEKRLMDVEHRQLYEKSHVVPQKEVDSKLDEILKKLEFIEHSQLMARIPVIDSEELKLTTKNNSNPNVLLEHYREALMRIREEKELANIAQQYKERFERLKKNQEAGTITISAKVEPFFKSNKDNTSSQIRNMTTMIKQDMIGDTGFKTDINKLLTQITKVNQGSLD